MQLAIYHEGANHIGSGAACHRRETTPVERILEGELLRGDHRSGGERRYSVDDDFGAAEAQARGTHYVPPPRPGHNAVALYLRIADPAAWSPQPTLHIIV